MPQSNETEIIRSIQRGNRQAFTILVNRYKRPIFNLCFRMTGSLEDTEDLSQETFLRAYKYLYRFEPEKPFYTWLYAICLNLIRNHLKKRNYAANRVSPQKDNLSGDTPERLLARKAETQRVQKCLIRLKPKYREAVILRYYQELTFREIAAVLGVSESAAKMRVYRGLNDLKGILAP